MWQILQNLSLLLSCPHSPPLRFQPHHSHPCHPHHQRYLQPLSVPTTVSLRTAPSLQVAPPHQSPLPTSTALGLHPCHMSPLSLCPRRQRNRQLSRPLWIAWQRRLRSPRPPLRSPRPPLGWSCSKWNMLSVQAVLLPLRWLSLLWCCWCLDLQHIWRSGIPPTEGFWMTMTTGPGETTTILSMMIPNRRMRPGMWNNCSLFISAYPVEFISTWCTLSDNLKPCFIGMIVLFSSLTSGCNPFPFLIQRESFFNGVCRLICD